MILKRGQQIVFPLFLCFFVVISASLLNHICFYTPDSAEYIILAKSLISGDGFRDISDIARPIHVKFPFMYPLILAVPVGLFSSYPILAAKVTTILLSLAVLLIFYRRLRHQSVFLNALIVTGLIMFNPIFLVFSSEPMAEMAYLLFSLLAIILIVSAAESDRLILTLASGLMIGVASWTRSIGVVLIPSALLFFLIRRQWKKGFLITGTAVIWVLIWMGRNFWVEQSSEIFIHGSYVSQLLTDYRSPLAQISNIPLLKKMIAYNALFYLRAIPYIISPLTYLNETELTMQITQPTLLWLQQSNFLKLAMRVFIYLLLIPGFLRFPRDPENRIIRVYTLFYLALLALYPIHEYRHLLPLLPLLMIFMAQGLGFYIRIFRIHRRWTPLILPVLAGLTYLTVDLSMAAHNLVRRRLYREQARGLWEDFPLQLHDRKSAGKWLRENSGSSDLVIGDHKEMYLLSHRRMITKHHYNAIFGTFEQSLNQSGTKFLISDTESGIPLADRLMAHAINYDFELVQKFAGINIYRIIRRAKMRIEYPPPDYINIIKKSRQRAEKYPYRFEAHNELGYFYFKTGDYPNAIESFKKALSLFPDNGITRFNLSISYLDSGQPVPAGRELIKCLSMPSALSFLKLVVINLKITRLLTEIEHEDTRSESYLKHLEIADLYFVQKSFKLALEHVRLSIALNPEFPDAYLLRGRCYEARGMLVEAKNAYQEALKIAPHNPAARRLLDNLP